MRADSARALFNPQLWRLEAARRRQQLGELQRYAAELERQYQDLAAEVEQFQKRYMELLTAPLMEVERLQNELMVKLDAIARAEGRPSPKAPAPRSHQALPELPTAKSLPSEPQDDSSTAAAPSLKELHRRAAMKLHPDRSTDPEERTRREALMRDANLAYADQDRATLESLLIASGESPQRLGGFDIHAQWQWLERCEHLVQGRLRVIQAHMVLLKQHPLTTLALAANAARTRGLDALLVMHARLISQSKELTQQLYIASRVTPRTPLSRQFLQQWLVRWGSDAGKVSDR